MKSFLNNYRNVLMSVISGILLILGSYTLIINLNHASYLDQKVIVRDEDSSFRKFKENVLKLENKINEENDSFLQVTVSLLKKSGIYKLLPGDKLGYRDLFELNNYFIEELFNNSWVSNLKQNNNFNSKYDVDYMNILIKNANYLNKELLNNSNYHYDVKNNDIRDVIVEEYLYILDNYYNYTVFILNNLEE